MTHSQLSRRRVMQLLAATMVGSATIPLSSFAQPIRDEEQSSDEPKPLYIPSGKGEKGKIAVNEITFKLNKEQTSGNLGSAETTLFPGYMGAVPHRHKSFDEVCRVLQGTLTIMVGEEIFKVEAGGWHLRPRGLVHSFWNRGKVPVKFIELYLPGGHEVYMQQLTDLFVNGRTPKPEEVDALAKKHDIEFFWDQLPPLLKKYKVRL
ncbi:cupin domain-containing protein [Adhaeribacter aquaticus]|uniref:cupin domain-containing protein n=1 Tax=Adhaeribacter aquaticus TaxID=299567 RepID=UPI00040C6CDE|nr:cupin domain-containing protein [Adhaeribacter aquaticus]